MRGDRVEIVVDAGGVTNNYEVAATRAGRRVEVVNRRGMIEVSELTRGGTPVRTARFMASRVIALVEHPAPRRAAEAEERRSGAPATGEGRRSGAPAASGEPRSGAPAATGERRAAAS